MIPYAREERRGKNRGPAATNKYEGEQGEATRKTEKERKMKKR